MRLSPIVLTVLLLGIGRVQAQQELSLHQAADIWHANTLNPAFFPEGKKLAIGLPSFGLDARHSGDIGYDDLIRREGDRRIIDFSNLIDRLDPENRVRYAHRLETFSVGIRLPMGLTAMAGHAVRLHADGRYPKSLPQLLWNGNGPYVGQTLDIAARAEVFDMNELSLGLAWQSGKWRIGGRYKYLNGISALATDDNRRRATVYTDDDIYQLTLQTDYAFHAASIISSIDTAGLGFDLETEVAEGRLFSSNRGQAFDLGVVFDLNDRLSLNASVLDLGGKIKWRSEAHYFHSNGAYTFDGVVFPGTDIINAADSLDFDTRLDTLNDIFQFVKTPSEFETSLPVRYYLGGNYRYSDRWTFGLSLFHQNGGAENTLTALGLSARWTPLQWLTLGGMYSVNDHSAANLGFQLVCKPGPVQIYLMSDNLLNAFSPYQSPAVNFRGGLALVF